MSGVATVVGEITAKNLVVAGLCKSTADINSDFVDISGVMKSENGLISIYGKEKI